MSKVKVQGNPSGTGTLTIAAPNTNSDRTLNLPDAAGTLVAKSGTYIAPSELGSGTPSASNFLRGDGSWQIIPAPSTANVLAATAGASLGAVGTYAFLFDTVAQTTTPGSTRAGSSLRYAGSSAGSNNSAESGVAASGTWRVMGGSGYLGGSPSTNAATRTSVWLRIS
jgi:hypothetical protein